MTHPKESPRTATATDGFEGEITGLGLSDIIQLNSQNRFSGCIGVEYDSRRGLIFLRDGEIIHAEQGSASGEHALYEILSWPGGRFTLQPNVATTLSTIHKSCHHLILEAHRVMDERRAGRASAPPPPAAAPTARKVPASTLVESVRRIPGVTYAVLQGKDGARIGDDSYEAEKLAGQGLYLAMIAQRIGASVQAGEVHSAVVRGEKHHLLLFGAKNHLLCVLVDAEAEVGAIEAEVRKVLTPGR